MLFRTTIAISLLAATFGPCEDEPPPSLVEPRPPSEENREWDIGHDVAEELGTTTGSSDQSIKVGTLEGTLPDSVEPLPAPATNVCPNVGRLSGADRFATAAAIARDGNYDPGATAVLVAGNAAVDALTAGPLARRVGGPVLLTGNESLPDATRQALQDLQIAEVVIVGGSLVVSGGVADAVQGLGIDVRRIAGPDRWSTAAEVAREVLAPEGLAFVSSGADRNLVDAVAAGAPASELGAPILYVGPDFVPEPTLDALADLGVAEIVLVGGTNAVSASVADRLRSEGYDVSRAAGGTRYETALRVVEAAEARGFSSKNVFVARGDELADALAASPSGAMIVLSPTGAMPDPVADFLLDRRPDRVMLLGGGQALSSTVAARACSIFHQAATLDGGVSDHIVFGAGLADHGDKNRKGSIAWFMRHAEPGHIVTLYGDDPFVFEQGMGIAEGVHLRGFEERPRTLVAGAGLDNRSMLGVSSDTSVRFLVLDGKHRAKHLITGKERSNVAIVGNTIRATKNNYADDSNGRRCHGVVIQRTSDLVIAGNDIRQAGYPKQNGTAWQGVCAGIYAPQSRGLRIEQNHVEETLTAGIDFTGTRNARVAGNTVIRSGRNREYGKPTADGITAYHNLAGADLQGFTVEGNTIRDSGHNGIHLSGAGVVVRNNRVENSHLVSILHQDHRVDQGEVVDCAHDVQIVDNTVIGGSHAVWIGDRYRKDQVEVGPHDGEINWEVHPDIYCD